MMTNNHGKWILSKTDKFWNEIAPNEHVVQIYEDDELFLQMLAGFTGSGINAGDSVIIIATAAHISSLERRLIAHGIYLPVLIESNTYIPIDAQELLSGFMVNGLPDKKLFMDLVSVILQKAIRNNKNVRAFGEMVALLWAEGLIDATIELEKLWNEVTANHKLTLFCAYPKNGFDYDTRRSINDICQTHCKMIEATEKPLTEILYRDVQHID